MEVIRGKRTFQMQSAEFHELISGHSQVIVDIGTGDGRFVYQLAQVHPEWFCVGVDPARENLEQYSSRICRKPRRGGLPNVLYVIASVENLPPQLEALAQQVTIYFPWGRLLEGVILGDRGMLTSIAATLCTGGSLEMLVNTSIFHDPVPIRVRDLPELTLDYVDGVMVPAYAEVGLTVVERRVLSDGEMRQVQTTWGKRLAYRRDPGTYHIQAEVRGRRDEDEVSHPQPADRGPL